MTKFAATLAFALMVCLVGQPASAATVTPMPDQDTCRLLLSGPIEQGDFDRFLIAAKTAFVPIEDVGESTASNTMCLDSPGGSLLEGMQFARHFYENGVGTVVRSGDLCASACALMFMMGRAVGPEVSFISRKLHIDGALGFHRPSLRLPIDDAFDSRDLEASYDMAVTSVVDYIVLANKTAPWSNKPMVLSDLVERIFATPGDDIYFIDTVEKAVRWDIDLMGVRYPSQIDEERAYYACENALQWRVGLYEEPLDFVGLNLIGHWSSAYSYGVPSQGGQRFSVTSNKAGYASAGCLVDFSEQRLKICGNDEYTGTVIGAGTCADDAADGFEWVSPLLLWESKTKLNELNNPWVSATKSGRCQVHSANGRMIDNERCVASIAFDYTEGDVAVTKTFVWPSGSATRVRSSGSGHQVNGDLADTNYVEGQDACYVNSRTGNRFCFDSD